MATEGTTATDLLGETVDEEGKSLASVWLVLGLQKVPEQRHVKPIKLYVISLNTFFNCVGLYLSLGGALRMSSSTFA